MTAILSFFLGDTGSRFFKLLFLNIDYYSNWTYAVNILKIFQLGPYLFVPFLTVILNFYDKTEVELKGCYFSVFGDVKQQKYAFEILKMSQLVLE